MAARECPSLACDDIDVCCVERDVLQLLGLDVSKSEIGMMLAEVDEDGSGEQGSKQAVVLV